MNSVPHVSWKSGCNTASAGRLALPDEVTGWVRCRPLRHLTGSATQSLHHQSLSGAEIGSTPEQGVDPALTAAQEAQHRVANSVQIIASILQHSLRNAASTEARREIEAAYQRIMAVAALNRALFETHGTVELAPYLEGIGQRIAQSFLTDGGSVELRVQCDPVTVTSATATNIGLVVTELLINAIKHAFPDGRRGSICVAFCQVGAGWTLAVSDDGIGQTTDPGQGLGSQIVPALAVQLDAVLSEQRTPGGTRLVLTKDVEHVARFR